MTKEDLACLNAGEFLNDVIIDFYLKSVVRLFVHPTVPDESGFRPGGLSLLLLLLAGSCSCRGSAGPYASAATSSAVSSTSS